MSIDQAERPPAIDPDTRTRVLEARGLVKTFGRVVGLGGVDLDLYEGEVLAINATSGDVLWTSS